jgi:hypothetical protein
MFALCAQSPRCAITSGTARDRDGRVRRRDHVFFLSVLLVFAANQVTSRPVTWAQLGMVKPLRQRRRGWGPCQHFVRECGNEPFLARALPAHEARTTNLITAVQTAAMNTLQPISMRVCNQVIIYSNARNRPAQYDLPKRLLALRPIDTISPGGQNRPRFL